jgi:subtilisin family serine protease
MKIIKYLIVSFFFIFSPTFFWGQLPAKYWIQFKDKQGTTFSVEKPEEFLSQRAIEKRQRFNIPVTEQDLPVNVQYIKQILALDTSMAYFTQSKWLNGITVYCEDEHIMDKIKQLDFVVYVERTILMKEPEKRYEDWFSYPVNDCNYAQRSTTLPQKDLDYGKSKGQIRINNAHWLHRLGYKGEGMLMMIIDGGFHNVDSIRHFAKLRAENRLFGARNYVLPAVDPMRKGSHGTYVLSCIAADIPGNLIGTAPMVSVYLAETEDGRTENKIEEDNLVAGLELADSLGCDVINISLGYTQFDDTIQPRRTHADLTGTISRASQAATIAASKGIIICNSAGNEGEKQWRKISSPADAKDILTVGGVDVNGNRAGFSSYGPAADGRVKPDACAVGRNTYAVNPYGKTTLINGTSFSSPLLSGMVACLWQIFPENSNYEIMEAVRKSGNQANHPDSSLGYGITDFLKAYNILKYPESVYDENGNLLMTTSLSNFVLSNKFIILSIESSDKKEIDIQIYHNEKAVLKPKTYKLKKGKNTLKIKYPVITVDTDFDFANLHITGENIEYRYVLGIEK